jgi:cell division protein FtsZ
MIGGELAQLTFGKASGEDRARRAARQAISAFPTDRPMRDARKILVNITCGPNLALIEVRQAIDLICESVKPNENLLFGAVIDPDFGDTFLVTTIANGYESIAGRKTIHRFLDLDI